MKEIITPVLKEFADFKNSADRNRWIGIDKDGLKVYVRKSHRSINGKMYPFLDLASVSVPENLQRKGIFTSFLESLLKEYPSHNFYIESIMNPVVVKIAEKFNFQKTQHFDNITANMYLLKNENS